MSLERPLEFSGFHELIRFRVREILLVATPYDAFVLEEDGALSERILSEYLELDLRYIPRISHAYSPDEALRMLRERPFDLVITMPRAGWMDPLELRRRVKSVVPDIPVVFLTYDLVEDRLRDALRREGGLDRIFFWTGDSRILVALIKLIEDARNAEHDMQAGVQAVLVVEDSYRYYSIFLPLIYTEILRQTRRHLREGVNDLHRLLRMRARPKILLAETWEQACALFDRYAWSLLGVVVDARFPRGGEPDPKAGFRFAEHVKARVRDLPVLLQSSEQENREEAWKRGLAFLDKNAPDLLAGLRSFILHNFGFGDFVFRYPDGRELCRARDLPELLERVQRVPRESLLYHAERNHFSIWLRARTEFELANELRSRRPGDFADLEEMRAWLVSRIRDFIEAKQRGVVRDFFSAWSPTGPSFTRIGSGSLGGKARGLAFLNQALARRDLAAAWPELRVQLPNTYVLAAGMYDAFLAEGDRLAQRFAGRVPDEEVDRAFLEVPLPPGLQSDLYALLEEVRKPLAVRSSSLLEDCQTLPFAGIYSTFMLPNNHPDIEVRMRQLADAIRLVYASVFHQKAKAYIRNTGYRTEDEKMAILVQEVAGSARGDLFYPTVSGVARSFNFYPYADCRPEDGVVSLAVGLGRTVVEGERVYHYCPERPQVGPPYGSVEELLWNTQTSFWALDLSRPDIRVRADEDFSLLRLPISRAEADGALQHVASTLVPGGTLKDALLPGGPRVLRFAQLLKYEVLPLNALLRDLLRFSQDSFGAPVELEFALDIPGGELSRATFSLLQVRPMGVVNRQCELDLEQLDPGELLCTSVTAMGNGAYEDLRDLVFLDPATFDLSESREIARELGQLNEELEAEGRGYVLIGFGRWGTSDPSLGVPVDWHQVSAARVFVEADRDDLWVEPSQGSHFFQNMVSLRLGYLFVRQANPLERVDWDWLLAQPAFRRTRHLRHLRFDRPLVAVFDGERSRAALFKPGVPARVC